MTDYQKYINALRKCAKEHENDTIYTGHIIVSDLCSDTANLLETLEQEPRKGHWIHGEYCSECGCDVPAYIIDWKWQKDMDAKYCPNCGVRMEEVKE